MTIATVPIGTICAEQSYLFTKYANNTWQDKALDLAQMMHSVYTHSIGYNDTGIYSTIGVHVGTIVQWWGL